MIYYPPDQKSQIDLSWLDNSQVSDISEDGKTILFSESGDAAEKNTVYLRNVDADAPVRLGEGFAVTLSPDQKLAIAFNPGSLTLIPTGTGESKMIRFGQHIGWAYWFPDGKRILFEGQGEKDHDDRLYTYQLDTGDIQPVSEEGVYLLPWPDIPFM